VLILLFLLPAHFSVSAVPLVQGPAPLSSPPPRQPFLSIAPRLGYDSAKFVNGDRLTGTLKAIDRGKVSFRLRLIEETAEFPVENLSEISLAGPPRSPPKRSDAIYLRDGSYLTASVTGVTSELLEAETSLGQTITIPKNEVIGIGFHRSDDVPFQSDFSQREETGLIPARGSWRVEKGRFVQGAPLPFCRAYVPVVQTGMMRYEWATDLSKSKTAGLLFFASRADTRFGQLAYMVMLRGKDTCLYKIVGGARHYAAKKRIQSAGPLVHFRAEYDPRNGEIVVWEENDILMRVFDPRPIRRGEYVLLHTEGKAAFDDVKIRHLVGTIQSVPPEGELDVVLLSNGDSVSGEVVGISEQVVLKNRYTPVETPIDRGRVRSIVFALSPGETQAEETDSPRISLWNGDLILGSIVGMDERKVTVRSSFAPELVIPKANLRTITFRQPASMESLREGTIGGRLLTVDMEAPIRAPDDSEGESP